ncbi:MAG: TetR/AcrR family transcriptional regulator [Gammaproteobacteria bacterium]|nr:TetR/AcrR family transcriptional regulator [Gammaproteobacteria bacterium]
MTTERDPEATRARIFDAALVEFAAAGPAGARVDAIAAAAGVNKRMLYHYFGSKEGLLDALREAQAERMGKAVIDEAQPLVEQMVHLQAAALAEGDWIRLSLWSGGGSSPLWTDAMQALRRAQARSHAAPEIDEGQLMLSLLALVTFPVAFPALTREVTGLDVHDPKFAQARADFLRRLMTTVAPSKPRYRLNADVRVS